MPEIMVRGIWIFSIHISMEMLAYSGMFYIDLNTNIYINNSIASYFVIDCHVWKDSLSQGHSLHIHNWIKVELQCFQFWIHFKCHFFYRILISIIYLTFYLFFVIAIRVYLLYLRAELIFASTANSTVVAAYFQNRNYYFAKIALSSVIEVTILKLCKSPIKWCLSKKKETLETWALLVLLTSFFFPFECRKCLSKVYTNSKHGSSFR